jgi:hypothetical protein
MFKKLWSKLFSRKVDRRSWAYPYNTVDPYPVRRQYLEDDRKFEREELGLKYKTIDELPESEQKQIVDSAIPVKEKMQDVVKKMPYEPFGVPGITNTTQFDGNLAQQYSQRTFTTDTPGTYAFTGTVNSKTVQSMEISNELKTNN